MRCRRHVIATTERCPFCETPNSGTLARLIDRGGRLSRAAVFAGLAACYTNPPPAQHVTPPPPPPPDNTTTVETEQQQFAQPPDGTATAAATGAIEGTLYAPNKAPMSGSWITLRGPNGEQRAQTDANGRYRFADLPPGNYSVEMPWNGNPHAPPPTRMVQVTAGQSATVDLTIYVPPPDRGPCCKPYGAPPARRRVV